MRKLILTVMLSVLFQANAQEASTGANPPRLPQFHYVKPEQHERLSPDAKACVSKIQNEITEFATYTLEEHSSRLGYAFQLFYDHCGTQAQQIPVTLVEHKPYLDPPSDMDAKLHLDLNPSELCSSQFNLTIQIHGKDCGRISAIKTTLEMSPLVQQILERDANELNNSPRRAGGNTPLENTTVIPSSDPATER